MPTAIISMAQQAMPKVIGQIDMARHISTNFWTAGVEINAGETRFTLCEAIWILRGHLKTPLRWKYTIAAPSTARKMSSLIEEPRLCGAP